MTIIDYINKTEKSIDTETIKAKVFEYEVTEEDLYKLADNQPAEPSINWIFLHKDNNIYEMIVDNIPGGRIVEGGITENKTAYIQYYVVEKGLNELLMALSLH